ncbi:hypothetical protein Ancab_002685 [Ancistrocladus abbreviatus]
MFVLTGNLALRMHTFSAHSSYSPMEEDSAPSPWPGCGVKPFGAVFLKFAETKVDWSDILWSSVVRACALFCRSGSFLCRRTAILYCMWVLEPLLEPCPPSRGQSHVHHQVENDSYNAGLCKNFRSIQDSVSLEFT